MKCKMKKKKSFLILVWIVFEYGNADLAVLPHLSLSGRGYFDCNCAVNMACSSETGAVLILLFTLSSSFGVNSDYSMQ